MHTKEEKTAAFGELLDIMDRLRADCPWNAAQTMETIRPMTEEEVYELSDAILKGDRDSTAKEIGDLLYHMVFYAKIAEEEGSFDIADSLRKICDKMIFRHPHVFGDEVGKPTSAKEIADTWELVKAKEKGGNKTVLGGIPDSLPSLVKAYRIQDKVANVGFDWEKREDVWEKVKEEIAEFEDELRARDEGQEANVEAEFGDLLFALINVARLYKIKPDNALEQTNLKFIRRFNYIEAKAKEQGKELKDMTLAEMDELWNEAKKLKADS